MKLKDAKKGDLVMLAKGSQAVYVKGHFDRKTRRYSLTRFDDINAERFVSGNTEVMTDFEF
jgi:hypothetical protein